MAATATQNEWVTRVLAVTFDDVAGTPGVDQTVEDDGAETPEDPYFLAERLQDGRQQAQILTRANDPAASELATMIAAVAKAIDGQDQNAPALMDEFEEKLAAAFSAKRARGVRQETRVPLELRKLLIEWHAAQAAVQQNIRALSDAYLDNEDVQDDPRFEDVFEVMMKLPELIPSFGDQLDTDINALLNDGGRSKEPIQAGLKTIGQYRQTLAGASVLAELETLAANDLGGRFGLFQTLSGAIDKIEAQMKSLAAA